jgi:signal transduction histidine kinase
VGRGLPGASSFSGTPTRVLVATALLGLGVVAYALHSVGGVGDPAYRGVFNHWLYDSLIVGSGILCLAGVQRRFGAMLLALGLLAAGASAFLFSVLVSGEEAPKTDPVDALRLASYAPLILGMILFLRRDRSKGARPRLVVDSLATGACAAVLALAVVLPSVTGAAEATARETGVVLAFALGDALLLGLAARDLVFAERGSRVQATLLSLGVASVAVADGSLLIQLARGSYAEGGATDVLWPAGTLLVALSVWVRPSTRREGSDARGAALTFLAILIVSGAVLSYEVGLGGSRLSLALSAGVLAFAAARLGHLAWGLMAERDDAHERARAARSAADVGVELMRGAHHELRDPLTAIRNLSEALLLDVDDEARGEIRAALSEEFRRLETATSRLLDPASVQAGTLRAEKAETSLDSLLSRVEGASTAFGGGRVSASLVGAEVWCLDAGLTELGLVNLVQNAVRHGRPPVVVEACSRENHIDFVVSDRGDGVPDEMIATLFEPGTHRAGSPGQGNGLALVRLLAEAQGGSLDYTKRPGKGGRFTLRLPAE